MKQMNMTNEAAETLAHQIIFQAVKDYRIALNTIYKNNESESAFHMIEEVRRFFHSDWYKQLTTFDGDDLLKMIEKDFKEKMKKRKKKKVFDVTFLDIF